MSNQTNFARELRHNLTPTERIIWQRIRDKQVNGLKFRRQQEFGPYVLDFYCHEIKLAIEIDGDVHAYKNQVVHDRQRENYLKNKGLTTFGFTSHEVFQELSAVLEKLFPLTLSPLPTGEGTRTGQLARGR